MSETYMLRSSSSQMVQKLDERSFQKTALNVVFSVVRIPYSTSRK